MEDIIQFLIIIGALFIGFVSQNKKKKRQTFEEAFPPITDDEEYEQEPEEYKQPDIPDYPSPTYQSIKAPQKASVSQTIRQAQTSPSTSPMQHLAQTTAPQKSNATRIDLRSPRKAREAFIYSEIFTRKYE